MIAYLAKILVIMWMMAAPLRADLQDPWSPGYGFSKRILITNLCPADPMVAHSDFPVLIAITNADWLDAWQSGGGDITFVGLDGAQLFHDLETFGIDGRGRATLQAWVCIPTFTNRTRIWMYWKNKGADLGFNGSNTTSRFAGVFPTLDTAAIRSRCWDSNYLVVMHFAETLGAPQDATAFACHATDVGTNISSNRPGIGVGMGNGLQSDWNQAWGGYGSLDMIYTAHNGPGWQGMYGIRVGAFNNLPGAHPAPDRLYSNGLSGGTFTHSLWVRYEEYPSNFYRGVVLAGGLPTSKYTNYVPATNASTAAALWGLRRAWGEPDSDGYGSCWITTTNGYPNFYYRGKFGQQSALRVTNTNVGPSGYYANWFKYDQVCTMDYGVNQATMRMVQNGTTIYSNLASPSAESGPRFNGLTLMGSTYEYIPANSCNLRGSPKASFDEYRLSAVARSSNWLLTEYSNVALTTNMALDHGLVAQRVEEVSDWFSNYIANHPSDTSDPIAVSGGAGAAALKLNPAVFLDSRDSVLRLGINPPPGTTRQVVISLRPLAGGMKRVVYDGRLNSSRPFVEIPAAQLARFMSLGTWVLEYQFPEMGIDRSATTVERRLLFYAR